jgi:hypothetical protein
MIESIVQACEKMAESRTGALIIIERQTKLGEFQEQENAVSWTRPCPRPCCSRFSTRVRRS